MKTSGHGSANNLFHSITCRDELEYVSQYSEQSTRYKYGNWASNLRRGKKVKVKVKQCRYRPGVAQRVPGS
jgi:hypothetical protein